LKKFLLAISLIAAAVTAGAQDLDRPLLLVAAPDLQGMYSRTALLVVPAAGGQHLGFILNRATDLKMATLFPEHAPSAKIADPVYFGGPEMMGSIFAIVRGNPGGAAMHLFGDLFVTGNGAAVDRIIEATPNDARYFAGFVGWQRHELAKELEAGFWVVAEPDPALLFSKDSAGMWDELLKRAGVRELPPGGKAI
jgi:putative transcriptional regulator